jgi:glutathione S-transferase
VAGYRLHCIGAVAEKHLADRAFMLGDRPSIVDFSLAGYAYYPKEETGFDIATDYPALHAWRERLAALPGWKPPYDMMPVGSDLRTSMLRPA